MATRAFATIWIGVVLCSSTLAEAAPRAVTAEEADRARIQRHLARVERALRTRDTSQLSRDQRRQRAMNLDRLHEYWVAGRFPRNTGHAHERRPYFMDYEGRACAAADLIIESGSRALAEDIDRRHHTDYVRDMRSEELVRWVDESGLTLDEVAWIQPTYCGCGYGDSGAPSQNPVPDAGGPQPYEPVCGSDGLTYWNRCAAELCGDIQVAHDGECSYPSPCTSIYFGDASPVVVECGYDAVCDMVGGDGVAKASEWMIETWLDGGTCVEAGAGGEAGSGGSAKDAGVDASAGEGAERSQESGCSTRGSNHGGAFASAMALLALLGFSRNKRRHDIVR